MQPRVVDYQSFISRPRQRCLSEIESPHDEWPPREVKGRVQADETRKTNTKQRRKSQLPTFEQAAFDGLAILFGFGLVVGIDLARVIGFHQRNILTHFARLPLVGEGRHRLLHVAFRRRQIVALVLVERAAQTLSTDRKVGQQPSRQSSASRQTRTCVLPKKEASASM